MSFIKHRHRDPDYPFIYRLTDLLVTLKSVWLLLVFDLLAFLALIATSQGSDMILCVGEDIARSFNHMISLFSPHSLQGTWIMPMVWLLVSILFWSISSEFCARLFIYLKDTSGRSLSPTRVTARKTLEKKASVAALFFPMVVTILGFIITILINYSELNRADNLNKSNNTDHIILALVFITVLILLEARLVYWLYLQNGIHNLSKKYKWLSWTRFEGQEKLWAEKLYGILNEVRVELPLTYQSDTHDLPRDQVLPNGIVLPRAFIAHAQNPYPDPNVSIWMFKIPARFYKCLRTQLIVFMGIAAVIILGFSLLIPIHLYRYVGSLAIIFIAFASWQLIYAGIFFTDKAQPFPVRLTLLVFLVVSSFINRDHEIRDLGQASGNKTQLADHFNRWFDHLSNAPGPMYKCGDSIPVVFVTAEGGALRTGAFTSMFLAALSDRFPLFNKHIYCYSSVSGGSLGANFFNATMLNHNVNSVNKTYKEDADNFYKNDFLAASIGKQLFGEVINYFIPVHIIPFDRAIALERSWEEGWKNTDTVKKHNYLAASFSKMMSDTLPAIFINTTEAETGYQCLWSNVALDSLPLCADGQSRDLMKRTGKDLRYSSAIGLSTRFPYISPAATIFYSPGKGVITKRHFLDGGYYENRGTETMLQVLKALPLTGKKIKPYLLQFNFADNDTTYGTIRLFNEVTEIIAGLYGTRTARGAIANLYLNEYISSKKGVAVSLSLPLTAKKFPMNWVLSQTAVERLNKAIATMVSLNNTDTTDTRDKKELKKMFMYSCIPVEHFPAQGPFLKK
ncbi:MAG: hypothetical protein JWN76_460 [Chitinophagaceae bacterium]|nr:hypothetical protein [Chitinophagaceae bacterium]